MSFLKHTIVPGVVNAFFLVSVGLAESPAALPDTFTFGVTEQGQGYEDVTWDILGQSSQPKIVSKEMFAFESVTNPGGGVPVHVHLTQDVMIMVQEGEIELKANEDWITLQQGDMGLAEKAGLSRTRTGPKETALRTARSC